MILAAAALALAAPNCGADNSAASLTCRAVAAADGKQYAEAAASFEGAANASPPSAEPTLRMWAAAGNMWIAAGQAGKAAAALDKALATPGLNPTQLGAAELDRARAAEMQGDLVAARKFETRAEAKISDDPFLWYFSSALALREGKAEVAKIAIGRALALDPNDPATLFEAGHVHELAGDDTRAREYWEKAVKVDPTGPSGSAAKRALSMLTVPLTVAKPGTVPTDDGKGAKSN